MLYMKTALNSGFLFSAREKLEEKNHFQKNVVISDFQNLLKTLCFFLVTENMIIVIIHDTEL